jgi:hypothetical protein
VAVSSRCMTSSRRQRKSERGGVLLAALIATLLATMLVMGAAYEAGTRLETRIRLRDGALGLVAGQAGLENAARLANASASWRSTLVSSIWIQDKPIGDAMVTVTALDPQDGDIRVRGVSESSSADSVELTATTQVGEILRTLTATYVPLPHPALRNVIFGATYMEFDGVSVEGRLRSNGNVVHVGGASIHGNITTLNGASVSSSLDDSDTDIFRDAATMALPAVDFTWFRDAGEQILLPVNRLISNTIITPSSNPLGTASANGIYWIDAGNGDLYLYNVAVEACIAVLNADDVSIGWSGTTTRYYHHSPDPDRLPAMLVDGDLRMYIEAGGSFTIPGGSVVTSDLEGVFYCTGYFYGPQVDASTPISVDGAIIANEVYLVGPGTTIRHAPHLNRDPLVELTKPGLRLVPGSTREG